ncbi:hypothetical protein ATANTOWER_000991 [Ataeniobius toweri]|uniref:Uncharacterized protein n=1 Tax=Ataeniobius toweri TaxID=208326 RepID=A0ABU7C4W6_9TELE|nr:hypothetical protein [Ataeniobius toweri]
MGPSWYCEMVDQMTAGEEVIQPCWRKCSSRTCRTPRHRPVGTEMDLPGKLKWTSVPSSLQLKGFGFEGSELLLGPTWPSQRIHWMFTGLEMMEADRSVFILPSRGKMWMFCIMNEATPGESEVNILFMEFCRFCHAAVHGQHRSLQLLSSSVL